MVAGLGKIYVQQKLESVNLFKKAAPDQWPKCESLVTDTIVELTTSK